jgi:hypothetical protein
MCLCRTMRKAVRNLMSSRWWIYPENRRNAGKHIRLNSATAMNYSNGTRTIQSSSVNTYVLYWVGFEFRPRTEIRVFSHILTVNLHILWHVIKMGHACYSPTFQPASYPIGSGGSFLAGLKRPGRETDHVVPRSRIVDLCLHPRIYLNGIVLS